jgi:hypothetical protein
MILIKHCSDLSTINHNFIKCLINRRLNEIGTGFTPQLTPMIDKI